MADVEVVLHSYMVELSISVYTKARSAVIIYPERIGEETAKKIKRREETIQERHGTKTCCKNRPMMQVMQHIEALWDSSL